MSSHRTGAIFAVMLTAGWIGGSAVADGPKTPQGTIQPGPPACTHAQEEYNEFKHDIIEPFVASRAKVSSRS